MKTLLTYLFALLSSVCIAQSITSAEYFFDEDLGVGSGTPLAVDNNSGQLTQSYAISLSGLGLTDGFHSFYIRTKKGDDNWSLYHRETIYVKNFDISHIVSAEYFFDEDLGVGTGTTLPVDSNSGQLVQSYAISLTGLGLAEGFHSFYIRTQDSNDHWSLYHREILYIKTFDFIPSEVTNAEYFIDSDPGIGGGAPVNFADSSLSTQMLSFSSKGLSEGDHIFYIRGQNEKGEWSIYDSALFNIDCSLGLEDSLYKSINIYPNPFESYISITSSRNLLVEKIAIYDFNGKTVYTSKENAKTLDLKFLAQGVYIFELHANDKKAAFKIVKQ